jgi:hypothetical protein
MYSALERLIGSDGKAIDAQVVHPQPECIE